MTQIIDFLQSIQMRSTSPLNCFIPYLVRFRGLILCSTFKSDASSAWTASCSKARLRGLTVGVERFDNLT